MFFSDRTRFPRGLRLRQCPVFILLLFASVLFGACNQHLSRTRQDIYVYTEAARYDTISFTLDSLHIQPDQVHNGMGGGYFSWFIKGDRSYLAVSTTDANSLDVYSLDDRRYVDSVATTNEPGRCNTTWSVRMKDTASCYVLTEASDLYFVHPGGRDSLINLNSTSAMKQNGMDVTVNLKHHNELTFSGEGRYLYFPVEYRRTHSRQEQRLMGRLDQETGEVAFTGIYRPDFLYKIDYGLLRNNIYHHVTDTCIYYSFEPVAEVWRYRFDTDTIWRHRVVSRYQDYETKPLPFERSPETQQLLLKHMLHSPYYTDLIYDPFRECFYRFHHLALPKLMKDGLPPTRRHKRVSLMVLDRNLDILGEVMLPPPCRFVYFSVPTRDGLVINYGPMNDPPSEGIPLLRVAWETRK